MPPPIDPGVFRSVTTIRRLIDEASDLAVRAASGLSASALGALRSPTSGGNPWATAQALGMGDQHSGRSVSMSSMRTHRLRVLAVQKLAEAYKADEIAASVMVMQGASALDDLAERVLKVGEPHSAEQHTTLSNGHKIRTISMLNMCISSMKRYPLGTYSCFLSQIVGLTHYYIPRQLAEFTTTQVLDELIDAQPSRLHYFRTRGIIRGFRDEYTLAIRDFSHALKESRTMRKARMSHHTDDVRRSKARTKKRAEPKANGQAPPSGTSVPDGENGSYSQPQQPHSSVGPDAPDPLEPQVLFLRAAAYLQNAVFLIEEAILAVEGVEKVPAQDALELKLSLVEKGKYGGASSEGPDGPLGPKRGAKMQAYRRALAHPPLVETVAGLLKKSIRDHEKFMTYFDTVNGALPTFDGNLAQRIESAFLLSESLRPGANSPPPPLPDNPGIFTTYHPLLVESHFSVLLCHALLGDFASAMPVYQRAAAIVDGLEGYPVFLPARSMAQAEFVEVLERLAATWSPGTQPHSLTRANTLMIEPAPPLELPANSAEALSESAESTRTTSPTTEDDMQSTPSSSTVSSLAITSFSYRRKDGLTAAVEESPLLPIEGNAAYNNALNLDCLRILLAPVVSRQRARAEKEAESTLNAKGEGGRKKKNGLSINIPLHSPRVDIVLTYIAAVHLPKLD
jgi:hypothetical protein